MTLASLSSVEWFFIFVVFIIIPITIGMWMGDDEEKVKKVKKWSFIIGGIVLSIFCIGIIIKDGIGNFLSGTMSISFLIGLVALVFSSEKSDGRYKTGYKDNTVPEFGVFGWALIVFLFSIAMLYIFDLPPIFAPNEDDI